MATKSSTHTSFVLSEEVSKNRQVQMTTSILLLAILGLQIYTLHTSINLFANTFA